MIALACDHTGIELKKEMMKLLDSMGLEWKDFGTDTAVSCDYPVYGYRAAKAVASGECDRGILICGTGIGIGIAASKVKGTRVCTCSDVYSAELSKRHNNSNILTMGARVVGVDLAKMIATHWLTAEFEGGRHQRRIDMITAIDGTEITSDSIVRSILNSKKPGETVEIEYYRKTTGQSYQGTLTLVEYQGE